MRATWRDPRDGVRWRITLTPFGTSGGLRHSITFSGPDGLFCKTPYAYDRGLRRLEDEQLIDLLDAALGRSGSPARRDVS